MTDDFNNWEAIAEKFDTAIWQVVRKSAFDIQGKAQVNAPVDVGFLKSSIYVSMPEESNYGQGVLPVPKGAELLTEEKPEDDKTAIIGVGASYGQYVEFGGRGPAQPFLIPAVDAVAPSFDTAMGLIEDKLREIRG